MFNWFYFLSLKLGLLVILIDFSATIPRCYKDVYVNSFFPCKAQTCHSIFIENTEKLIEFFKGKVKGLWSTSKACWGRGWGPGEPWWGLGVKAPETFCNLALLETPWFAYFTIVANTKNNAQEDYVCYKKACGWYEVVIVKVGIKATC